MALHTHTLAHETLKHVSARRNALATLQLPSDPKVANLDDVLLRQENVLRLRPTLVSTEQSRHRRVSAPTDLEIAMQHIARVYVLHSK
jgi:hypothetical protein